MKLLVDCLNRYLEDTPFPGLTFEALEKVEFGTRGGVLGPGKVLLEVTFSSRWKVPVVIGERELREAALRGKAACVQKLMKLGHPEAAESLERMLRLEAGKQSGLTGFLPSREEILAARAEKQK